MTYKVFISKVKRRLSDILGPSGITGYLRTRIRTFTYTHLIREKNVGSAIPSTNRDATEDSQGIFYIAFGDKYVSEAIHSAKSVRKVSNTPMSICCDTLPDDAKSLFDKVQIIKPEHIRAKVDYLENTPYIRTLYLDSDTQVEEDISHLFDILDKYDVALTHDFARKRHRWSEIIPEYAAIPEGFSEYAGGVILYHKTRAVDFTNKWKTYFYKNFKKTNGWDQASLRIALWHSSCQTYALPTEYNVRSENVRKKTDGLPKQEGGLHPLRPRVLHWHGLDDPEDKTKRYMF